MSRLVRRRTLANDLCRAGRVTLNGRVAGPADRVRPDDVIVLKVADRLLRVRVRALPGPHPGAADDCWEVLAESSEDTRG